MRLGREYYPPPSIGAQRRRPMSDTPQSSFDILHDARHTARRFAIDGVPWLIYELPPLVFDRRNSATLIFESDDVMRRVRNYPPQWRELSDDDLFAISWSA